VYPLSQRCTKFGDCHSSSIAVEKGATGGGGQVSDAVSILPTQRILQVQYHTYKLGSRNFPTLPRTWTRRSRQPTRRWRASPTTSPRRACSSRSPRPVWQNCSLTWSTPATAWPPSKVQFWLLGSCVCHLGVVWAKSLPWMRAPHHL